MKAMIFAAGLGTRLRPFTDTMPKALLPLAGKTLLEHQLLKLRTAGITDIVVNVHHFADKIVDYLARNDNFGCNIRISDETDSLLDTGGGLLKAWPLLHDSQHADEAVLACNVDILSNISLRDLLSAHRNDSLATLVVSERPTQRYLLFDDSKCSGGGLRMVGWTNISTGELRPDGLTAARAEHARRLAFSGMQVLAPEAYRLLREVAKQKGNKFSLIDLYLHACQAYSINAFVPSGYRMMDVGKTDQLSEAEQFAQTLDN